MTVSSLRHLKPLVIACAFAATPLAAVSQSQSIDTRSAAAPSADFRSDLYIVGFRDAPLALYDGSNSRFAAIPRNADNKLDFKSSAALAYQSKLTADQDAFLDSASQALSRSVAPFRPEFRFQHAFNGMVLSLSAAEAARLQAMPEVMLVEAYREDELHTDVGPTLIGAPTIWNGANAPNGFRSKGEGIVVGVIDSGANLANPAFSDDVPAITLAGATRPIPITTPFVIPATTS